CDAMGGAAQGATGRRHAVADQLLAAVDVEQLELHAERVLSRLRKLANDYRLDSQYRPVVEIDIHAGGRLLQHVPFFDWREPSASLKIRGNDTGYIDRRAHATGPAERGDSNRRLVTGAARDLDFQLRKRVDTGEDRRKDRKQEQGNAARKICCHS